MVYSQDLADRLRAQLAPVKGVTEREMFGGISFMVGGNMCCGVLGNDLLFRIDPTLHHDALTRPHVREFEMGGRSSKGMIRVGPGPELDDDEFGLWFRLGVNHASALPPKTAAKKVATPAKKVAKKKAAPPDKKKKAAVKAPAKKTPAKKKAPVKKRVAVKKRAPARKATKAVKKTVKKTAKKTAKRRR